MPERVRRSRARGSKLPPNTVCVTRPGRWGNPFIVGELPPWCKNLLEQDVDYTTPMLQADVVKVFERWLERHSKGKALAIAAKAELAGKNLACWCKIGDPCHADVLLRIANEK